MSEKRKALGRGLAALLPTETPTRTSGDGLRTVSVEEIHPSRQQPRKNFDDARIGELAESIKSQGIIQPLVVRKRAQGGFELIAGERRWRAAQKAGVLQVPVVVRDVADGRAFEMALVENLQREDLNPIEEAEGYQRLSQEFGYTQESLATRVGKERSTVANALRLLKLPTSVRALVVDGRLGMGHARALLGLDSNAEIERVARLAVTRGLSARQVEEMVRGERSAKPAKAETRPSPAVGGQQPPPQRNPSAPADVVAQIAEGRQGT